MKTILTIERETTKKENDYIVTIKLKHCDGRTRTYSYEQQNGVANIQEKAYEEEIIKLLIQRLFDKQA